MSIPPLVCSTPPPLEQCEEDKDCEEYDLQYNLSSYEDDDCNDFNYENFNSFNNLQPISPGATVKNELINEVADEQSLSENLKTAEVVADNYVDKDKNINGLNNEEEVNIEDLNLKMDREEPPDIILDPEENSECVSSNIDDNATSTPNSSCDIDDHNCTVSSPVTEIFNNLTIIHDVEDIVTTKEEIASSEINKDQIANDNQQDVKYSEHVTCERGTQDLDIISDKIKNYEELDDDFDDFQFITSNKSVNNSVKDVYVDQESPWGNEESTQSEFGTFTANFEDSASQLQSQVEKNNDSNYNSIISQEDDDDFGEFDDFKSSTAGVKSDVKSETLPQQVPVLNLQSYPGNENQIMESINKVLTSIFKEEAMESESMLEAKLDSVLNETWGHLMETDVRQPYIVNWNNSLAQKTLLKALCIDSRNILFGPKWSYNMPKYAANLTTAPLQPQKQSSTANNQSETSTADKTIPKTAAWSDPFETNGQESCSNEGENAVIEPRPTDLDVFEAAMSTKKDKIYSSTISVQPIRQINLPDTHIFTPTDSETPRSKTIHYDSSPVSTVLIPQPIMDTLKIEDNNTVTQSVVNAPSSTDMDNDYWEFQDFKATPVEINPQSIEKNNVHDNPLPKQNITYQTQLLQPIKLEPIMPTLNWPDPGEIKETFEHFSDFVSNSTNNVAKSVTSEGNGTLTNEIAVNPMSAEMHSKQESTNSNGNFDDEFDTFQSAPVPPTHSTNFEFDFSHVENKVTSAKACDNNVHENKSEFKCVFPSNDKPNNISYSNFSVPLETMSQPVNSSNLKVPSPPEISLANTTILQPSSLLQPMPVTIGQSSTISGVTIQDQQKSGQILHPLSLESYSKINWPNPGINLQDLSRFNPVETLPSLKSETSGNSKGGTPIHSHKQIVNSQASDDDIWGEFVSSNPKPTPATQRKAVIEDDEWTDFVSSSNVKPQNGLNTISFNVYTNSNMQKSSNQSKIIKNNQIPLDIPSLNYITPKTGNQKSYNDKHFQNL